ncbi:MAG: acetate uptake transporter [Chloroflexi bacterium]|nr:acetate uptake transporter [Chloroflexota bacterium]
MSVEQIERTIKDTTANPAPLGLIAFGMTTVLLNLHNAGFYAINGMILAMGLAYGGLAQIIVGILEWKKGNTFGMVAFGSYGFFWWSFAGLVMIPDYSQLVTSATNLANPFAVARGPFVAYLVIWGIFTGIMFFGTLKLNKCLQFIFGSLTILFFLLAIGKFNPTVMKIAGWEGIICGASAFYTGLAITLNETYKKTVLPIWPVVASPSPKK